MGVLVSVWIGRVVYGRVFRSLFPFYAETFVGLVRLLVKRILGCSVSVADILVLVSAYSYSQGDGRIIVSRGLVMVVLVHLFGLVCRFSGV